MSNNAKAKLELLRRKAWDDFYIFSKYVCKHELLEEIPHREVCEFLTAGLHKSPILNLNCNAVVTHPYVINCEQLLKKLLMLPRNSFKSTIASGDFILWLLWHNQNLRILIDSETLSNAKLYLAAIKDQIENNELLRAVCTDENGVYLLEPNKNVPGGFTEDSLILAGRTTLGKKEPTVFCAGVDNARTGMHPDVIIMDDLVSERNVSTPQQLKKTGDHYRFSLSLLEVGGLQVVIGTRYHMADLYGDLLDSGAFDTLVRPAILPSGSLFFPTRLTHEFLQDMKAQQGSHIFNSQYMLTPIDDSDAIFKQEHIQYYKGDPRGIQNVYMLIDLAISQKESADWTVIMVVGVTADKDVYILEYERGHYKPKDTIDAIFDIYSRYKGKCRVVGVESVNFQKAMIYLLEDEMRRRGIRLPLKELKADKDKYRRIKALQPMFENLKVFMKPWHKALEQELLEFPFSKHDDCADALAYLLQVMRPGEFRMLITRPTVYYNANKVTGY